jgi:hypothetical protein
MKVQGQKPVGAHLVGSIPLGGPAEVFQIAGSILDA